MMRTFQVFFLIKELAGAHLCGPFFVVQRRRDFSRKDFLWNVECGMWNEKCWEARKEEGFFEEGVRSKEEGEILSLKRKSPEGRHLQGIIHFRGARRLSCHRRLLGQGCCCRSLAESRPAGCRSQNPECQSPAGCLTPAGCRCHPPRSCRWRGEP